MTGNYAFTPSVYSSFLTVLLLLALFAYVWPRSNRPGAQVFGVCILLGVFWAAGSAMEFAALSAVAKIFWIKFQAVWQLPATIAITCFLLEYTWPGRWLTRRYLALFSIAPLLLLLLVATNDLHHWFWLGFDIIDTAVLPLRGPAAWFFITIAFGVSLVNLIPLGWLFVHSPQHRWSVVVIVAGQIGIRALYLLDGASFLSPAFPFEILGLAFADLMYTAALFGFRLFDPIPLAQQAAIDQMQTGMLVLDSQGRVSSLNPCAERILGDSTRHLKGRPISEVLPSYPDKILASPGETEIELAPPGDSPHHYTLTISPLTDFRGLEVSRLLLLRDVTEQKRAHAQIVEQQRSLAMLQEREQLARELHDSTAQVLGYAGFQIEAILNHVQDGQAAIAADHSAEACLQFGQAEIQLTRLENIVADAQADVREYILNLRLAPSDQRPFFATLQHYLDGFCQNYGIRAEFSVGTGLGDEIFEPGMQMQVFRIIQETLSNARKHAQASSVQLSIEKQASVVRVQIQDNGRGFDPTAVASKGESHFGLRFMRERAEQIGGSLQVDSAPGKGTCVILDIPHRANVEQGIGNSALLTDPKELER